MKAEMPPGDGVIVISTKLNNEKIPEWFISHVKNGESTDVEFKGFIIFDLKVAEFKYPIEQRASIKTDILSGISFKGGDVSVGPVKLRIKFVEIRWGEVKQDYIEILTLATIYNDNLVPVPVTKFRYSIEMNGVKVSEGVSNVGTVIPPKSEATITLVSRIDNRMLAEWFVEHIRNRERTEMRVLIKPFVEAMGKEFSFPLESESTFKTRIFGCSMHFLDSLPRKRFGGDWMKFGYCFNLSCSALFPRQSRDIGSAGFEGCERRNYPGDPDGW